MNGIIILLGAPNDNSGNLPSIAAERCLEAMRLYKRHWEFGILPTEGFGEHFNRAANPHAHYTRNFLIEKGVPAEDVLEPALSRFTLEDASLSKPIVSRYSVENLIVVTSDFHLERARLVFEQTFKGYDLSFRGSKTNLSLNELATLIKHEKQAIARYKAS